MDSCFTTTHNIVWQTADGDSSFYEGDSFALMQSMPTDSVDCIWTDPPYLLSNGGTTCIAGKRVSVNKGKWDHSQGLELDHEFNHSWLSECYRILKPAGTIWVTGTLHVYLSVGMAMMQLGFRILNDITWEKTNPPPNLGCRCFTHSTETVLWATKAQKGSKHKYTFNYQDMKLEKWRQADEKRVALSRQRERMRKSSANTLLRSLSLLLSDASVQAQTRGTWSLTHSQVLERQGLQLWGWVEDSSDVSARKNTLTLRSNGCLL